MPRVSVIIPTWNGADLLVVALDSLRIQEYRDFETIVVDNGSSDGTVALLAERYPEVRLVRMPHNRGFAPAVNEGIRAAKGDILVLMNNDVRAEPAWLRALTAALDARPEVGSVASRMLDAKRPGIIDAAGDAMALVAWNVGRGEPDGPRFATGREVLSACAGAAAYRRAVFDRVGTLDERYFAWFEDVDLGLRAQIAGFRCWYEPTAVVHHLGSATGARMSDLKVFYAYRNAMLLFFKTMPLRRVLAWGLVMLIWPWLAPAALGVPLRPTLRGWLAFFPLVPHVLRTRRGTYARRRVPVRNLMRLLDSPLDDFARVWGSLSTRLRGRSRQAGVGARGAAA